jgi:glyceraldehyde 3-phosphate dehydrogenase (phosphorylating)
LSVRVGINGLGRIGRTLFRLIWNRRDMEVAAVNDLAPPRTLAHLLRNDSGSGRWGVPVEGGDGSLRLGGRVIPCSSYRLPPEIPWEKAGVELVVEATGLFRERLSAEGHLGRGVQRVVISAPSPDADLTVVVGVNHRDFEPSRHFIVSNASCTTNCFAPILMLVHRELGVEAATLSTIHCYTNDQFLVDAPHRDLRRARAAGLSMIPTSTSASQALEKVLPALAGRMTCLAIRVPAAQVSAVEMVLMLGRDALAGAVREMFIAAEKGPLAGILGYTEEELVSMDYRGDSRSAVVDGPLLALPCPRLLKVFGWYDNETGYSHRLVDLILHLSGAPGGKS